MKVCINFWSFLLKSLDSITYRVLSSNRDKFISSFPICLHFVSISCSISLDKTKYYIYKRRKTEYPCLIPDLSGEAFHLVLVIHSSHIVFIRQLLLFLVSSGLLT